MEKEVLTKIYMLRKIKPESAWKESAKDSILERGDFAVEKNIFSKEAVEVFVNYLTFPINQNKLVMASAFLFLLFFGFLVNPLLPSNYEEANIDYVIAPLPVNLAESRETLRIIPDDTASIEVAETIKPLTKEVAILEDNFKGLRKQVLGVMLDTTEEKEIAEKLIAELEATEKEEVSAVSVMSLEEDTEEEADQSKLAKMKEAYEDEYYDKVVDIYFE